MSSWEVSTWKKELSVFSPQKRQGLNFILLCLFVEYKNEYNTTK